MFKKATAIFLVLCFVALTVCGCGNSNGKGSRDASKPVVETNLSKLNMKKWQYSAEFDFYYQIGIDYCEKPADNSYEKLAVFVPAAYMKAKDNGDSTFTCKLDKNAKTNGYTSSTAPIVMSVITPAYASDKALTESLLDERGGFLNLMAAFTSQGLVFVHAGCRGGYEGAPAGVTDLKAAIRYLRYSDDKIAGDAEKIFVFGTSGGGAQSAILGASGDSKLYDPYLKRIGAVQGASDSVAGSMSWCPITDLNTANAEYEWMMGASRSKRTDEEQAISDKLAEAYADYVNNAGFTDKNGSKLTLSKSDKGIYQAGSYYDYIKKVIEKSLNNYLSDTDFFDSSPQEYINELNADKKWVAYDQKTNTAKITSIADFSKNCKKATDDFVAFDRPVVENSLFGLGKGKGLHFDKILAGILTELKSKYASAYNADLKKTDSEGNSVEQRVDMYTPLYYLMKSQKGYGTSKVAKYWRIRSGIEQNNTSVTTEVNLALALEQNKAVKSVDFETVWAQGHTEAERDGDSTSNFISWVKNCVKAK